MPIQKQQSPSKSTSSSSYSSSSSEGPPSSPPRAPPSAKKVIPQKPKPKPKPKPNSKPKLKSEQTPIPDPPQEPPEDSADGRKPLDKEESESETETGSSSEYYHSPEKYEPRKSALTVKPISSKPMDETPKPKKPVKAATKPVPASPSKSTAPKRPPQPNKDEKESKKKKKSADDDDEEEDASKKSVEDPKKLLFQRFWSEEDEIAILKGLVEYLKKGTDIGDFYEYIKKSFHVEVNRNQLLDKIRRLKKKYQNNLTKREKYGKDPSFSKPHEQKAYDLSKKIWGRDEVNETNGDFGGNNSVVTKKGHKGNDTVLASLNSTIVTRKENHPTERGGNWQNGFLYSCLNESKLNLNSLGSSSESILKRGLDLIENSKAKELEEKWKKLQMMEIEVYLKRVDMVREQMKLILEALKSSGSQRVR